MCYFTLTVCRPVSLEKKKKHLFTDTKRSRENQLSFLIALSKHRCITCEKGRKNNKVFLNKLNLSGRSAGPAHKTEDFSRKSIQIH